jgi:hypothetical protein
MNRNDFLNLLEKKTPVDRNMLGEVYELVDLFPYFQSAHLLLLKGLKETEDVKFDRQLKNSALHIADREVLYYLLKSDTPSVGNANQVTEAIENVRTEPAVEEPDTEQTVIEIANSEELITEIEKEIIETGESSRGEETQIHDVLSPENDEKDESVSVILVMEGEEEGEEEKIVFMDPGFSFPEEESDLLELDTDPVEQYSLQPRDKNNEPGLSEDAVLKTGDRKQKQNELIDKFIIANPRIEPVREKGILPVEDLSKPHVEEKGGFVTETLAKIYITQGYFSKAIDIYEKLSLKFPEKSSYFAAQIEKVKEYIKK